MSKTATADSFIRVRISSAQKRKAARILKSRGLTLSLFVRNAVRQIVEADARAAEDPDAALRKALDDTEKGIGLSPRYRSADEAISALWK